MTKKKKKTKKIKPGSKRLKTLSASERVVKSKCWECEDDALWGLPYCGEHVPMEILKAQLGVLNRRLGLEEIKPDPKQEEKSNLSCDSTDLKEK